DPSPAPLAQPDLDRALPLKKGSPFHAADAAAAIDHLFASGRFEDIVVDAEPSGPDGVIIRFVTKQAYFIGHIEIAGRAPAPPNRGQLVNVTQLNLGEKYRDTELVTAQANIKKLLEANGFYEASVEPSVSRDPKTQTVNFTFMVQSGHRAKYTTPTIRGTP